VHEKDVVVDENIITCSYYGYVGRFMQAVFDTVASRAGAVSSPAERESAERESAEPVHPAEQTRAAAEPVLA
jgi:hypothetical protein